MALNTGIGGFQTSPNVFVIHHDEKARHTLDQLFRSAGLPVRLFESPVEFVREWDLHHVDARGVIVAPLRGPEVGGLELQQAMVARFAKLPVVLLADRGDVDLAVRALQVGASDVVAQLSSGEAVLASVRRAADGHAQEAAEARALRAAKTHHATLTHRERQVMDLVVRGRMNKEMAAELHLSPKTIECHRAQVMKKMEVDNLPDLVRMSLLLEHGHDAAPAADFVRSAAPAQGLRHAQYASVVEV